jgi:hypothetical protein
MTNLVTSPEASMFEKPTAADIKTGKKLTKAANATRDSLLIPCYRQTRVRAQFSESNQLEYDENGVITKTIHLQK